MQSRDYASLDEVGFRRRNLVDKVRQRIPHRLVYLCCSHNRPRLFMLDGELALGEQRYLGFHALDGGGEELGVYHFGVPTIL